VRFSRTSVGSNLPHFWRGSAVGGRPSEASGRGCSARAIYGLDNRKNKFPADGVMEMLFVPSLELMA
jgi:hypothetical protein